MEAMVITASFTVALPAVDQATSNVTAGPIASEILE
jgi:hypothetical protein